MVRRIAYGTNVYALRTDYDRILASCRKQKITHLCMLAGFTGRVCGAPEELAYWRDRLEMGGLTIWGALIGIGHPTGAYYTAQGAPVPDLYYDGDLVMRDKMSPEISLLPRGWQYGVNEFGNPVYGAACANEACIAGNQWLLRQVAPIFDELWYDDDLRLDGDQGAGHPFHSTATCYCDRCLADLSARLGRPVTREQVLADQSLSDAWTDQRIDKVSALWRAICDTAREVNPKASMGLMVRWSGEERDALDIDRLLPSFGAKPLLRAGEGHFTKGEIDQPVCQVMEHLVTSYHVSWFPHDVDVWSETTYFSGVNHQDLRKKVALSLGAGTRAIAYCPCVPANEWLTSQDYMAEDDAAIEAWGAATGDAAKQHQPIAILRSKSAGRGDRHPTQRIRDRQVFPLFGLAGLFSTVIRQGHWRDTGEQQILAITGRTAWDFSLVTLGASELVVDGAALLENTPLNAQLGVTSVAKGADGCVTFTGGGFKSDGLLKTRGNITIAPYVWQDIPEPLLTQLLGDIRRVLAPKTDAVVVQGDLGVLPIHYRHSERDAILLVNMRHEPRTVELELKGARTRLVDGVGQPIANKMTLAADEVALIFAAL